MHKETVVAIDMVNCNCLDDLQMQW